MSRAEVRTARAGATTSFLRGDRRDSRRRKEKKYRHLEKSFFFLLTKKKRRRCRRVSDGATGEGWMGRGEGHAQADGVGDEPREVQVEDAHGAAPGDARERAGRRRVLPREGRRGQRVFLADALLVARRLLDPRGARRRSVPRARPRSPSAPPRSRSSRRVARRRPRRAPAGGGGPVTGGRGAEGVRGAVFDAPGLGGRARRARGRSEGGRSGGRSAEQRRRLLETLEGGRDAE